MRALAPRARPLEEHPVGQVVAPADLIEVHAEAVGQKAPQPPSHHLEVGAQLDRFHPSKHSQTTRQAPRDRDVTLPHLGAKNQHAHGFDSITRFRCG